MHTQRIFLAILTIFSFIFLNSCKNSTTDDPNGPDGSLYGQLKNNTFAYYKGENVILEGKGSSPHGKFKLRFNAKALAALDSMGKLPVGATFPDSAIVLKEVYNNNNELTQYVPMMRLRSGENSASGWVWAQYSPDGEVDYSVSKKGGKCVSCHSANGNRDLTLTFDLH